MGACGAQIVVLKWNPPPPARLHATQRVIKRRYDATTTNVECGDVRLLVLILAIPETENCDQAGSQIRRMDLDENGWWGKVWSAVVQARSGKACIHA